jgi:hypothetical protein
MLSQFMHISFEIYSVLFEIKYLGGKLSYRVRNVPWWEIILQTKKGSLIRNYLTEQEKYKFCHLKSNSLMWNYLTEKKRIAFYGVDHW